jgi:hypothetical protein
MERSIEKLSILSLKTSVSAGHSALQNAGRKKKIRLWSTLFSSSTPKKMIHVIEKKILPPSEERSTEKELSVLYRIRPSNFKLLA